MSNASYLVSLHSIFQPIDKTMQLCFSFIGCLWSHSYIYLASGFLQEFKVMQKVLMDAENDRLPWNLMLHCVPIHMFRFWLLARIQVMQKGPARSVDMLMDAEIDYPWNLMPHSDEGLLF